MAESFDPFIQERRGLFDGLRVPFDVNMLLLGTLAVAVFVGCIWGIEHVDNEPHILPRLTVKFMGGDYQAYETNACSRTIHGLLGTYQPWGKVLEDYMKAKDIQDVTTAQKKILNFNYSHYFMILLVLIVVWSFFGSAINRIAAMRIAREETLEIKEAMFFARDKFTSNFFSIVFLLFMFAFFYDPPTADYCSQLPG